MGDKEPGDDKKIEKVSESSTLDAFRRGAKDVVGMFTGVAAQFYQFQYIDTKPPKPPKLCHSGRICHVTTDHFVLAQENSDGLAKEIGNAASFWIFEPEKQKEMRDLTSLLSPLSHNALLKPLHVAYNSQIEKTVVSCTECNKSLKSWLVNEVVVPPDGYISSDAQNTIISIVSLSDLMWEQGFVCDNLDLPSSYVMMGSQVKLLPFEIRVKANGDTKMAQQNKVANLLEHNMNSIWEDPDVTEFIAALRNPSASLKFLIDHPLLVTPDRKMSMFLMFKMIEIPAAAKSLYGSLAFNNWTSSIPASETVLLKILTYKKGDENNTTCVYQNTPLELHRFCCNVCSHYHTHWRKLIESCKRSKAPADMVVKKLKLYFPGFQSVVYALTLTDEWDSSNV